MAGSLRVLQYVNQFFAGIGGEAAASHPVEVRSGALGPGRALEGQLTGQGSVIGTIVGGDNYFQEQADEARAAVRAALAEIRPDVVVAGPAFGAGRYGLACGEVCKLAQEAGIPAVAGMHPENPAVLMYRESVPIVPTSARATDMQVALGQMARLAVKLGRGEELAPAEVDGYLPRGIRKPGVRPEPGYKRGVDMLVAKLRGEPYASEVSYQGPEWVEPAPAVADLSHAKVALVSAAGLIPKGNPDNQLAGNPRRYFRYSVAGMDRLAPDDWDALHAGYFTHIVKQNPNYALPLDFTRELAAAGAIGEVHPDIYTFPGVSTPVARSKELGRGIAAELKEGGVDCAFLVAT